MPRLRDLDVTIGRLEPGPFNAITDVTGVRVGHTTVVREPAVHTGVTVVVPRAPSDGASFAAIHRLNGNGELTGSHWIEESGLLGGPIGLTNTFSVGTVHQALVAHEIGLLARSGLGDAWALPVVGETFDGTLNDIAGFHVTADHVDTALRAATDGPVEQGAVGGGTGMICHEFKGGIGTSSRRLPRALGGWTVGAIVQANHGVRADLRVDGAPVGRVLGYDRVPSPYHPDESDKAGSGSIIVVLATDAPLLPHACRRLAQRATIGLARAGGGCSDSSGDLFLAFATGNPGIPAADYARPRTDPHTVQSLPTEAMSPLFAAAAEATEEAIIDALLAAHTVTGNGRTAHALTPDLLLGALEMVGRRSGSAT